MIPDKPKPPRELKLRAKLDDDTEKTNGKLQNLLVCKSHGFVGGIERFKTDSVGSLDQTLARCIASVDHYDRDITRVAVLLNSYNDHIAIFHSRAHAVSANAKSGEFTCLSHVSGDLFPIFDVGDRFDRYSGGYSSKYGDSDPLRGFDSASVEIV